MRRLLLLLPLCLLLACGGDDSNGPSDAQVGGPWRFSWSNLSGSGISCNVTGDFQLTQTGTTFSGLQTAAGVITCVSGSDSFQEPFSGETLASGTVDGNAVSFQLGSVQSTHNGTVTGTSMSGTATWTFDLGGGSVITLSGGWSAVRL